jgi:hypothetical protein
MKGN